MKWSNSKIQTLRQCHRKYYFQYILADHHFTHPIRRKAYELAKSQNLKMWQGSLVDWAVTNCIIPAYKAKQQPDFERIAEETIAIAQKQFAFSESGAYKVKGNSKNKLAESFQILAYHDWGRQYDEVAIFEVYTKVKDILLAFPNYDSPEKGKTLNQYLFESSFLKPNEEWWQYEYADIELNPQIDLIRFKGKAIHVIDWKVSASVSSDYSRQLNIAGIVTLHNKKKENEAKGWTAPRLEDVSLFQINLYNGDVQKHLFNKETIASTLDRIYLDSEREQLEEKVKWNEVAADTFEITDKTSTCAMCKFKPLCIYLIQNNFQYDESRYSKLVQTAELA